MTKEIEMLTQSVLAQIELLKQHKAMEALMDIEEKAGEAKMWVINNKNS